MRNATYSGKNKHSTKMPKGSQVICQRAVIDIIDLCYFHNQTGRSLKHHISIPVSYLFVDFKRLLVQWRQMYWITYLIDRQHLHSLQYLGRGTSNEVALASIHSKSNYYRYIHMWI